MSLTPHFIDLVYDALLKSYWTRKGLRNFLRRSGIAEKALIPQGEDETKRDILDRIFPKLETAAKGPALINQMARALAEQTTFPDLQGFERSAEMIPAAKGAVKALKDYIDQKDADRESAKEREKVRERAKEEREKVLRSQQDLSRLKGRFEALYPELGTQRGGYKFQDWFYDLLKFGDVEHRRPYNIDGRQIDGSITIEGTTYLVELKFTGEQAGATDIDSLKAKVNSKADNTMAIMVSVSGYSSVAVSESSYPKTPLLLLDHGHLFMVLQGIARLPDVIRRVRRHSSQTGRAYLATADFGGAVT